MSEAIAGRTWAWLLEEKRRAGDYMWRSVQVDDAWGHDDYLAVAAFALLDQPFGFTWSDVDLIQGRADWWLERARRWKEEGEPAENVDHWVERAVQAAGLANRIAALLPPRAPHESNPS